MRTQKTSSIGKGVEQLSSATFMSNLTLFQPYITNIQAT